MFASSGLSLVAFLALFYRGGRRNLLMAALSGDSKHQAGDVAIPKKGNMMTTRSH